MSSQDALQQELMRTWGKASTFVKSSWGPDTASCSSS